MDKELIIKSFSEELSSVDKQTLNEWLAASEENRQEYDLLNKFWHNQQEPSAYPPKQKIWRKIDVATSNNRRQIPLRAVLKYAASVSILLLLTFTLYIYLEKNAQSGERGSIAQVATDLIEKENPKGQKSTLILPDGSKVYLNANSKLSFSEKFVQETRDIYLTGEAFFEVAEDPTHPFIVHTGSVDVVVKGTAFNVNTKDDKTNTSVTVESGLVSVQAEDSSLLISKHQKIIFDQQRQSLSHASFNKNDWAWKDRSLIFENATLDEVIHELEVWYGVDIAKRGKLNFNKRIKGEYQDESLKNVLEGISFATGIQFELEGKKVTFYTK